MIVYKPYRKENNIPSPFRTLSKFLGLPLILFSDDSFHKKSINLLRRNTLHSEAKRKFFGKRKRRLPILARMRSRLRTIINVKCYLCNSAKAHKRHSQYTCRDHSNRNILHCLRKIGRGELFTHPRKYNHCQKET